MIGLMHEIVCLRASLISVQCYGGQKQERCTCCHTLSFPDPALYFITIQFTICIFHSTEFCVLLTQMIEGYALTLLLTNFRFLWPCIVSKLWSERENRQDATVRCLLSTLSQHVSGIIMPIFRTTRRVLLNVVCCAVTSGEKVDY